jgi:hypothetical protein
MVVGDDEHINNATIQKFSHVYEDVQETFETNYFGTKIVIKELFSLLKSISLAKACIVMVFSQNGLLGVGNLVLHLHITLVITIFCIFAISKLLQIVDYNFSCFFRVGWHFRSNV